MASVTLGLLEPAALKSVKFSCQQLFSASVSGKCSDEISMKRSDEISVKRSDKLSGKC